MSEANVLAVGPVLLHCRECGFSTSYERPRHNDDLPVDVVRIETSGCINCDKDSGAFYSETWFDKDGEEVVPE